MLMFTIAEISLIIAMLGIIAKNAAPEVAFAASSSDSPLSVIVKINPNIYFEVNGGPDGGGMGAFSSPEGLGGTSFGLGAGAPRPQGADAPTDISANQENAKLTHGKKNFFRKLTDRIADIFGGGLC